MKIGAGFIIYKIQNNKIKFFVLYKKNNQIDLPKGGWDKEIDSNSLLNTALRETYEESSLRIKHNNILLDKFDKPLCKTFKNLTFFIAKHDDSQPEILKNPSTNIIEHIGFDWLFIEEMLYSAPNYLIKPIIWSFKQIKIKEGITS
jgi:8-oxo-dGTP pyrophosphatase MutT (NUDIX family)